MRAPPNVQACTDILKCLWKGLRNPWLGDGTKRDKLGRWELDFFSSPGFAKPPYPVQLCPQTPMMPRRYHRIRAVLDKRQPDLTVMMENVHKPHNLSAILRTCDAVGAFEAHAVSEKGAVQTFNSTAQGSQKWVQLAVHPSTDEAISHLQERGFKVYSAHLSEKAIDYRQIDFTQPSAVLLGAEKWGVSDRAAELCDQHIIIPMVGMVESLNVSVANSVILFEAQRQRMLAGMYDQPRIEPEEYDRILFEWAYPELALKYRERHERYPRLDGEGQLLERGSL